jgi:hypothetical protein
LCSNLNRKADFVTFGESPIFLYNVYMETSLRKSRFTIETFPGETFKGYTFEDDWNGWACPYFDLEEATRILDIYNMKSGNARYNESNDEFIFIEDEEIFPAVEIEGLKLYPIGNSIWIWEEAT